MPLFPAISPGRERAPHHRVPGSVGDGGGVHSALPRSTVAAANASAMTASTSSATRRMAAP